MPIKSAINKRNLHAIQPLNPEDVLKNMVRGQYGAGTVDG